MNIVFAASECVPFSKTGGLADVVGALPKALAELGHNVSVYLPKYKQTRLTDAKTVLHSVTVPFDDQYRFCSVLDGGKHSGVQFYFIAHPPFRGVATVFTIHNMGYQGLFPPDTLPLLMLPWDLFTIDKMEFWGKVNFLKGALVFSSYITTVSKKYSQEIQTPEYGFGLE